MKLSPRRLLAGTILTLALSAPSVAHAVPVTVRIAGDTAPARLGPVAVNTVPGGTFGPDSCPTGSAGGAIDLAVAQNWDRDSFTQTILGESHTFSANDYWSFWINETAAQQGICAYTPQPGDRLLMVATISGASFEPTIVPLSFGSAPSTATAGVPFQVTVRRHVSDGTTTTPTPIAGATVTAGSASAVTDGAGVATLTVADPGTVQLVATAANSVSTDPRSLTVVAPAPAPAPTPTPEPATPDPVAPPAPPTPDPVTPAPITPVEDTTAPVSRLEEVRAGRTYRPRRAPRELAGRVTDNGSVTRVEVRLKRQVGDRCWTFDGERERFRRISCERDGAWFAVGTSADWSYLLPERLRQGRYAIAVRGADAAGNVGAPDRARFRVA
ncbi:MAG TPA: hypothetical protein VIL49_10635 [Capillimicrobium sp.]|jgi:hypothetical protein